MPVVPDPKTVRADPESRDVGSGHGVVGGTGPTQENHCRTTRCSHDTLSNKHSITRCHQPNHPSTQLSRSNVFQYRSGRWAGKRRAESKNRCAMWVSSELLKCMLKSEAGNWTKAKRTIVRVKSRTGSDLGSDKVGPTQSRVSSEPLAGGHVV